MAFVRGIHRWPVNSPHKWPVTRKMISFDDVIMSVSHLCCTHLAANCSCMQITIANQICKQANQYPAYNHWKCCSVLESRAFPKRDVENYFTRCHLESPPSLKTSGQMPQTNSRPSSTRPHLRTQAADWYHLHWCRQAASHYLNQWWPKSPMPCGPTWPHWLNKHRSLWLKLCRFNRKMTRSISFNWRCKKKKKKDSSYTKYRAIKWFLLNCHGMI